MKVGIVGAGSIGSKLARDLDLDTVSGVSVAAICSRTESRARKLNETLKSEIKITSLQGVVDESDLVIEAAGAPAVEEIVTTALSAGKSVMVISCGALLGRDDLVDMAKQNNARIHVPSGAIIGLDGLLAASEGKIENITMITTKPPQGLKGSPGVEMANIDLDHITEAIEVFEGPVSEGYKRFPANVNVAAAVSMAGIGADKTRIRVIADPKVTRNTHDIIAEGEFGRLTLHIENVPSDDNPRTGKLTALSALAYLKQMVSPLSIGI
tara:strand:- start:491 stop:1294 length:804 start_codon:yes stop_codon:yes gene_type:complete